MINLNRICDLFKIFYPTEYCKSAYDIDFQKLYDKGYRGLLTDVDNTLVEHGASADKKAKEFFENLSKMGWKTCIISNNNENRVASFADDVKSTYVYDAGKPKAFGYKRGMRLMHTDQSNTLFLGDQLFTDIFGANRFGLKSILVDPIKLDRYPLILLKRLGEMIIKFFYLRSQYRQSVKL